MPGRDRGLLPCHFPSDLKSVAPPAPLPENLRNIARAAIQRSAALIYSRYFARAELPKQKANLPMELLLDRIMVEMKAASL
jgi:hypothetical protein